jgi:hypothetical protein
MPERAARGGAGPAGASPRIPALAAFLLAAALLAPALPAGAAPRPRPVTVPLPGYPVAAPGPVGDSQLPASLADVEEVRARLSPKGGIGSVVDDVRLAAGGSGDFRIVLPGAVRGVRSLGGDVPPALQDGHVVFQGRLGGAPLTLAAEAQLDPSVYTPPVAQRIFYSRGGLQVQPGRVSGQAGIYREDIEVDNLTATDTPLVTGTPDARQLATVLEALRSLDNVYTPSTDLASLYPIPAQLTLTPPTETVVEPALVPMRATTTLRLPAGSRVVDAGGAEVTRKPGGTVLQWTYRLPFQPGEPGINRLEAAFQTPAFSTPGVETRFEIRPMPGELFVPPGGGAWSSYLAVLPPAPALALLAEGGMASVHRIGDLAPPVGRPGPGPVTLGFDLVVDRGAPAAPPAAAAPARAQPWAVLAALLALLFLASNAWWAWSRH